MRYATINNCDSINVISGLSVSLWSQGCPHECPQCFNESTWDAEGGYYFDVEAEYELLKSLNNKYITTLSILGGEPLAPHNREDVSWLTRTAKLLYPEKTIMLWTGYRMQDIMKMDLDISAIDYIIDGRFISSMADKKLKLRGSSNQTVWENTTEEWIPLTDKEIDNLVRRD